jgi:hypothetical protein
METALEIILTTSYKAEMISYMEANPKAYGEAIQLALSDKQPYAWRAAWLLWSCIEENDQRMQGHIKRIIDAIPTKNDDHQRELIKILLLMELSEEEEGILFDKCVNIWKIINKKASVRFNAFKMIVKVARKHPDLKYEIKLLCQEHYLQSLSSAARKSILKMANEFIT